MSGDEAGQEKNTEMVTSSLLLMTKSNASGWFTVNLYNIEILECNHQTRDFSDSTTRN